jgi:hypothetical protein
VNHTKVGTLKCVFCTVPNITIQALSRLNSSAIGWAYSATSCAPLPNTLPPIQVPIVQFAPFPLDHLSKNGLARLLRSISIQTNVVEGVLKLNPGEIETLITLGFASSTFSQAFPQKEYIQQVLLDSQTATQSVFDRIGSANAKFDEAFACELHKVFTKTACIATQRAGQEVRSVYIGRGRYKFISNHVFARNGAYHIYCRPEEVPAEMEKIFGMLEVGIYFFPMASSDYFVYTELLRKHSKDT